jgi:hypothetical protein
VIIIQQHPVEFSGNGIESQKYKHRVIMKAIKKIARKVLKGVCVWEDLWRGDKYD